MSPDLDGANRSEPPLLRLLRMFMRHSVDDMTALLREHGLSMPQIGALQLLRAEGPQTVSAVADHLNLSLGATSHLVERLVQKDLVARTENPADRRQKLVSLRPAGMDLIAEIDRRSAASMQALLQNVSEPSRVALDEAVERALREFGDERA